MDLKKADRPGVGEYVVEMRRLEPDTGACWKVRSDVHANPERA
jgi:hypothetical protein